jgi:hypothetical protein
MRGGGEEGGKGTKETVAKEIEMIELVARSKGVRNPP